MRALDNFALMCALEIVAGARKFCGYVRAIENFSNISSSTVAVYSTVPVYVIYGKQFYTLNLGRYTFRIILDSINGLIDLGIPEGLTILHMSARAGNKPGCGKIMRWKPDYYNTITINGETALSFAAQKGHKETCELIIKMSRDLRGTKNDFKTIEMILHQDRNGLTALHKAVERNHPEVVNYFVRHELFGKQITNLLTYDLQTPLDVARKNGLDVSEAILKDNGGKDNSAVIASVVEGHVISGTKRKVDRRRMYYLLKGTIDRRKFASFQRLLKAGFDPSGIVIEKYPNGSSTQIFVLQQCDYFIEKLKTRSVQLV